MYLAASLGGHLELLASVGAGLTDYDRVWFTAAGGGAKPLREGGEDLRDLPLFSRTHARSAVRNVIGSLRAVVRERPQVVVTSGAGSVVAFCVFARALGARVLFVETTARVTSASASGRILSGIASKTLVQWPEMAKVYPRAIVCRPALWEQALQENRKQTVGGAGPAQANGRAGRAGTVVSVGTHRDPFDRLLAVVDRAVAAGLLPGPVIAQSGTSRYRPSHFEVEPWIPQERVAEAIEQSEYVVCHAGSAIISAALRNGHKPLVLARRASDGEHVDDHQLQIVDKLSSMGLIVPVEQEIEAGHTAAASADSLDHLPSMEGAPVNEIVANELSLLLSAAR